jgi:UDP-N-acetylmuramate dehydrogenase
VKNLKIKKEKTSLSLKEKISLREYSTIKIGGPARFLVEAHSKEDLAHALLLATSEKIPYAVVGRGSNTLFDDRGFDGLAIINRYSSISEITPGRFRVASGTSLPLLSMKTTTKGWGGLEWSLGIPGSIGGALTMNAGASQSEISDSLEEIVYLHETGEIETFKREDLTFSYRRSPFQEMKGVILEATFALTNDPEARGRQLAVFEERRRKQPYHEPSLGCIFRNPMGISCGKLIEELGLKGMKMGGAHISPLHGNFITNPNEGTARDVFALIQLIEEKMWAEKELHLEKEIRIVPYSI